MRSAFLTAPLIVLLAACGGTQAGGGETAGPTRCVSLPDDEGARHDAVDALGHRVWAAMSEASPEDLLYDDLALRILLSPTAATRFAARRISFSERIGSSANFASLISNAAYAGVCLQGARSEEAGGVLGLEEDGWVFDRLLLIGRRQDGQRLAAWIEGLFLYSDAGFFALDLERVEEPRWEHSDLEIAPCDLAIRNDLPQIAR